jgi:hypothetical protein
MESYTPTIDLNNCPLKNEEIGAAILAIPGAESYGGQTQFMMAFRLAGGSMVLMIRLPGMERITVICSKGHPEEFGEVATALARLFMS